MGRTIGFGALSIAVALSVQPGCSGSEKELAPPKEPNLRPSEVVVVTPATTRTVAERIVVPARRVTVAMRDDPSVKLLPGTEVVLTEPEYRQELVRVSAAR
jgi:hypothetical protein